jgi:FlaG/FlaF family flagellin (archaellin)
MGVVVARARTLAQDERGIALVLALMTMLSLTILLAGTMTLSSAAPRDSSRHNADQKAYAIAETGINNAVSMITKCGQACSFSGVPQTVDGGNVTVTVSALAPDKTYTITSVAKVPNPTGPSTADVSRTITAKVLLNPPPFTFVSLNPSCDNHTLVVRLGGRLKVASNVYVNSCSPSDGFDLFGAGSFIAPGISTFGGWETHDGSTVTVGTDTDPVCQPLPAGTTKVAPPDPTPAWPHCP